jgi:hypothetical protein
MPEALDIITEVQNLSETFRKQQQELIDKLKPNFHGLFKPFLETHPEIKALTFEAYTPYFNDGDTCEYTVGELKIVPTDEELEPGWDIGFEESEVKYNSSLTDEQRETLTNWFKDLEPIQNAFRAIPEEVIEGIVGDHVRVTITLDGVETEDYDHD